MRGGQSLIKILHRFTIGVAACCFALNGRASFAEALPPQLGAAITAKIIGYEVNLAKQSPLTVWVFGTKEFEKTLRSYFPANTNVVLNPALVGSVPNVIFINESQQNIDAILRFVTGEGTLTVANGLAYQYSGAAVILANDEGVPGIFVNLNACKKQALYWDPAFLDWVTPIVE